MTVHLSVLCNYIAILQLRDNLQLNLFFDFTGDVGMLFIILLIVVLTTVSCTGIQRGQYGVYVCCAYVHEWTCVCLCACTVYCVSVLYSQVCVHATVM